MLKLCGKKMWKDKTCHMKAGHKPPCRSKSIEDRAARRREIYPTSACRANHIQQDYGIPAKEYDARLAAQNNICDACKRPFAPTAKLRPTLDHNHNTGKPRGFVHSNCNVAIGMVNDDPLTLRLLAEYLEKYDA